IGENRSISVANVTFAGGAYFSDPSVFASNSLFGFTFGKKDVIVPAEMTVSETVMVDSSICSEIGLFPYSFTLGDEQGNELAELAVSINCLPDVEVRVQQSMTGEAEVKVKNNFNDDYVVRYSPVALNHSSISMWNTYTDNGGGHFPEFPNTGTIAGYWGNGHGDTQISQRVIDTPKGAIAISELAFAIGGNGLRVVLDQPDIKNLKFNLTIQQASSATVINVSSEDAIVVQEIDGATSWSFGLEQYTSPYFAFYNDEADAIVWSFEFESDQGSPIPLQYNLCRGCEVVIPSTFTCPDYSSNLLFGNIEIINGQGLVIDRQQLICPRKDIQRIAAGGDQSFVLDKENELWGWGDNRQFDLGVTGGNDYHIIPISI